MANNPSYNFQRVFFRRPLWTADNIRLFISLVLTASVILSLLLLSIRYYDRYPERRIRRKAKQNYIAHLVRLYRDHASLAPSPETSPPSLPPDTSPEIAIVLLPEKSTFTERDSTIEVESDSLNPPGKDVIGTLLPRGTTASPDLIAFLKSSRESRLSVRNAIGEIASLVKPSAAEWRSPVESYRMNQRKYEARIRTYVPQKQDSGVTIPKAQFTDFEIVKGFRDYEETMSVVSTNRRSLKPCFDRLHRQDPSARGSVTLKFDIHPDGYVIPESIRIIHTDIKDPRILQCIKRSIRRWRNFPPVALEMGQYTITQKYVF